MSYVHIPRLRRARRPFGDDADTEDMTAYEADRAAQVANIAYTSVVTQNQVQKSQTAQDVAYLTAQDATKYPWGKYSDSTRTLQDNANLVLGQSGSVCKLDRTGVLDALTCGAARATMQYVPYTCKSFADSCPAVVQAIKDDAAAKAAAAAKAKAAAAKVVVVKPAPATLPVVLPVAAKTGITTTQAGMLAGGAALCAVVVVGYYVAKKKGWLKT